MSQPKKTKYPKKFHQTLEKVAAGREAREGVSDTDTEDGPHPFDVMYRSMLPKGSVHLMHSRLEDTSFGPRLITRYGLLADTDVYDLIRVPAPFDEPGPA